MSVRNNIEIQLSTIESSDIRLRGRVNHKISPIKYTQSSFETCLFFFRIPLI